jgi:hypothetical protein
VQYIDLRYKNQAILKGGEIIWLAKRGKTLLQA